MEELMQQTHIEQQTNMEAKVSLQERASNAVSNTPPTTLKIVLRTVAVFVVTAMFLSALFVSFFPHATMRLYFNLGLRGMTHHQAQRVVVTRQGRGDYNRYDSTFADGLFMAATLSGEFLQDRIIAGNTHSSATLRIARQAYRYNDMLLNEYSTLATIRNRDVLDPARLDTALLRADRPHLYRFESVVRQNRIRAMYVLGEYDTLAGEFLAQTNVLRADTEDTTDGVTGDPNVGQLTPALLEEYAFLFTEINALIQAELRSMGYDTIRQNHYNPNGTPKPSRIEAIAGLNPRGHFAAFVNPNTLNRTQITLNIQRSILEVFGFIMAHNPTTEAEFLQRTWWGLTLSNLATNLALVTEIFYHTRSQFNLGQEHIVQAWHDWRDQYNNYYVDGTHFTSAAWYTQIILRQYVQFIL